MASLAATSEKICQYKSLLGREYGDSPDDILADFLNNPNPSITTEDEFYCQQILLELDDVINSYFKTTDYLINDITVYNDTFLVLVRIHFLKV